MAYKTLEIIFSQRYALNKIKQAFIKSIMHL